MYSRGMELIRQGLELLAGSATEELTERLAAADAEVAGLTGDELVRAEVARATQGAKAAGATPAEIVEVAKKTFTSASRTVRAAAKAAEKGGRGDLAQALPTPPLAELGAALLEFRGLIDGLEAEWSRRFATFCGFDGPARVYGQRPATMLTHRCGMRSGTAITRDKLAATWQQLPRCRALLEDGKIGIGHLEVAGEALADALAATAMDPDELTAKLDSVLADHAPSQSPKQLAATAHEQAGRLDADACDNQAAAAHRQRSCRLTLTNGGTGWQLRPAAKPPATPSSAPPWTPSSTTNGPKDQHRPAWTTAAAPSATPPTGAATGKGCDCGCVDCRAPGRDQQLYDALIRAFQTTNTGTGLSTAGARERAKVQIVLTPDTLAGTPGAPPAETNHGQILTRLAARALAKDCLLQRLIIEPLTRKVLDLGRTMRCFPKRIADAIKTQYRTCQYPGGCNVPIAYTDLHHDGIPWWDGGPSNPDNALPYCHAHNIQAEIDRLHPNPGKAGEPGRPVPYREDQPADGPDTTNPKTGNPGEPGSPARYRHDPHRRDWTTHHPDAA